MITTTRPNVVHTSMRFSKTVFECLFCSMGYPGRLSENRKISRYVISSNRHVISSKARNLIISTSYKIRLLEQPHSSCFSKTFFHITHYGFRPQRSTKVLLLPVMTECKRHDCFWRLQHLVLPKIDIEIKSVLPIP